VAGAPYVPDFPVNRVAAVGGLVLVSGIVFKFDFEGQHIELHTEALARRAGGGFRRVARFGPTPVGDPFSGPAANLDGAALAASPGLLALGDPIEGLRLLAPFEGPRLWLPLALGGGGEAQPPISGGSASGSSVIVGVNHGP
jgi:hypothetical protein